MINSRKRTQEVLSDDLCNHKIKKQKILKLKECLICMTKINENNIINIHKNHFIMCKDCLIEQSKVLLRNRDLLPWKCSYCKEELSLSILKDIMDINDYNKLVKRQTEKITGKTLSCLQCDTTYCIPNNLQGGFINCNLCNSNIHLTTDLSVGKTNGTQPLGNEDTSCLIHLANQKGWAQCPGCNELIEKIDGCNSMTHHENNGTVTKFCYLCNEILDDSDIDSKGNNHFPNGSYNNCINTNYNSNDEITNFLINGDFIDDINLDVLINNSSEQIYDNIDYNNFNWNTNNNNESDDESDDELYYCTECDYYGYTENALQQHINTKGHEETFNCTECDYSENH